MSFRLILLILSLSVVSACLIIAQSRGGEGDRSRYERSYQEDYRQAGGRSRPMPSRDEFPIWENEPGLEEDVFTFVRIQYDSYGSFGWWSRWDNDFPDGDWNFSYRLQQMTSMKVAPESKVLRLTDPELVNFPFVYMAGVGKIIFSEQERTAFRKYLLNGGFVMMDDFWAQDAIDNVMMEMRGVFPDIQPVELTIDHPIFHCVFDLKKLPQVVDLRTWREGHLFEYRHGDSEGDEAPHFWAYLDARGRIMALLCHNNDLGDGWEREGENHEFFLRFSEKMSYPMGINIITYALTH